MAHAAPTENRRPDSLDRPHNAIAMNGIAATENAIKRWNFLNSGLR